MEPTRAGGPLSPAQTSWTEPEWLVDDEPPVLVCSVTETDAIAEPFLNGDVAFTGTTTRWAWWLHL